MLWFFFQARKLIRPYFLVNKYLKMFYDFLTIVLARVSIVYFSYPFIMLDFWPSLIIYRYRCKNRSSTLQMEVRTTNLSLFILFTAGEFGSRPMSQHFWWYSYYRQFISTCQNQPLLSWIKNCHIFCACKNSFFAFIRRNRISEW